MSLLAKYERFNLHPINWLWTIWTIWDLVWSVSVDLSECGLFPIRISSLCLRGKISTFERHPWANWNLGFIFDRQPENCGHRILTVSEWQEYFMICVALLTDLPHRMLQQQEVYSLSPISRVSLTILKGKMSMWLYFLAKIVVIWMI